MAFNGIFFLFALITCATASGQIDRFSCNCAKNQFAGIKADTSFHLSNGKTIVLCGYKNLETSPTTFSEFVLSVCGQDTIIGFWPASVTCRINIIKDTLIVQQIDNLPTGKNLKYQPTNWAVEKIYFNGEKIKRIFTINRQIAKYSKGEILNVLKLFENAAPGLNESKMELLNDLFIATISGSIKAGRYFTEFKTKFGILDGAFLEEYDELEVKLKQWNKISSNTNDR